jgi:hypothetical protein
VLVAAWGYDVFVLRTSHLAGRGKLLALTPLYTFWEPVWRTWALAFPAFAAWFAWSAPRLADPLRVSKARFAPQLFAWAIVLPFALFLVRQSPSEFGDLPRIFRYRDLIQDAERVQSVATFLRGYVELMPTLSLHGQHYPPGPAIWLHLWYGVFGQTPQVAGMSVLIAFGVGIVAVWGALREIASERAARQGALLTLAVPAVLDHACTSIDALFFAFAAGAWWCALRVFGARERAAAGAGSGAGMAMLLGVLLLLATLISFSGLPLGFAVLVYALLRWRANVVRLLIVGGAFAASAVLLWAVSGFAIWECLHSARDHAERFMGPMIAGSSRATWAYRSYGNIVGYLIGAGVALCVGVAARIGAGGAARDRWAVAVAIALGVMTFANIYYMETERIWIFAMPWLAAIVVGGSSGGLEDASMRRLVAAGALQAVMMECLLFTFW